MVVRKKHRDEHVFRHTPCQDNSRQGLEQIVGFSLLSKIFGLYLFEEHASCAELTNPNDVSACRR
jgi:hypothetical protein